MVFVGFFAVLVVLRVFVLMRCRGRNGRQGRSGTSSRRTWCFVFEVISYWGSFAAYSRMGGLPVRKFARSTLQNVSCFVKLFCDCMRARVSFERPVWLGVMRHTAVFLVGSICSHGSLPHKQICCCTRKAKPRLLKPQRKSSIAVAS